MFFSSLALVDKNPSISGMRYDTIDPSFFTKNRAGLVDRLKPNSLVIIHANDLLPTNADGSIPFRQNNDLFYFTGVDQEQTVFLIFPDAQQERDREVLFVRETSEKIAVWEGDMLNKEQAEGVSGIKNVQWSANFEAFLHRLAPQVEHIYLHTNEHISASNIVETRNGRFIKECMERYPLHRYERVAPLTNELRMIKDVEEIRFLQKAVDITEAGFRRVLGFIKPGVGEWEIEAEYIHEFIKSKSRGFAYTPIIGSGKNGCVLHYLENEAICQDGEMVLMDVGAEYGNWNADMTRTVPVNGKFTDRQRDVYNAVLRVMRGANTILRPEIKPTDYQEQVIGMMSQELVGLGLVEQADVDKAVTPEEKKAVISEYFMHGTSHHLGLDVHDVSPFNSPVKVGNVFTIEPGIYIRKEGLAVRLEDDVFIGEEENINLFENFPIEVEEIEALMQG
ncbi:aminopeptidase P N-terminal domain-containing protein [Akkermansiaceae bacterium]|nr:aminopeptidase P N-terminal domain-containing protein [Akkermansiaceae bacterium]|tara:strand:- start:2789 stop:4138 length:1350 start_codon:yes stop_codon:yes gene_type:complete